MSRFLSGFSYKHVTFMSYSSGRVKASESHISRFLVQYLLGSLEVVVLPLKEIILFLFTEIVLSEFLKSESGSASILVLKTTAKGSGRQAGGRKKKEDKGRRNRRKGGRGQRGEKQ